MILRVTYPDGKRTRFTDITDFAEVIQIVRRVKKNGGRARMKIPTSWNK